MGPEGSLSLGTLFFEDLSQVINLGTFAAKNCSQTEQLVMQVTLSSSSPVGSAKLTITGEEGANCYSVIVAEPQDFFHRKIRAEDGSSIYPFCITKVEGYDGSITTTESLQPSPSGVSWFTEQNGRNPLFSSVYGTSYMPTWSTVGYSSSSDKFGRITVQAAQPSDSAATASPLVTVTDTYGSNTAQGFPTSTVSMNNTTKVEEPGGTTIGAESTGLPNASVTSDSGFVSTTVVSFLPQETDTVGSTAFTCRCPS
jgi:hypothetical protein